MKTLAKYFAFFLLAAIGFIKTAVAQIDREFWFVAPEITDIHADKPVYLRLTTFDQAANVSISQPANPGFLTITRFINANTSATIDLTSLLSSLENTPEDQVLNKGLHIESDADITAYYEVFGSNFFGAGVNSDIFVLKGNYALGTEFYTPFQSHWDNRASINAWSSIDIVATEDNTVVQITPTQDVVGHLAGITYSVTLNEGETYSARAASNLASQHLGGTHVTSNKPIAITLKDDSILESSNWDTAGDQLVPVNVTGTKYILIRGALPGFSNDRVYICATQNNTDVFLNGNPLAVATLNAGQQYEHLLTNASDYLETSSPAYVWHISGFGNELAGALLPPFGCSGSRQVSFVRSSPENFILNIIVKSGYENYFTLNGNNSLVPGTSFQNVNGTSGAWKYAQISFNNTQIPIRQANRLRNDSADFHLAILNGLPDNTGFRYGYFSDFGFLELGTDVAICQGDSALLNAGYGKSSYLWTTGGSGQYVYAKDSGTVKVTVTKGACTFEDSVKISFHPQPSGAILGNDTAICANDPFVLQVISTFDDYRWIQGGTGNTFKPYFSGYYWVDVYNSFGCKERDSTFVQIENLPYPKIIFNRDEESFCRDSTVNLDAGGSFATYQWSTGQTTQTISTPHLMDDVYAVTVTNSFGCSNTDVLAIDCSPYIGLIPNLITSNQDNLNDLFYIDHIRPNKWVLEVFNRWGDRVYYNKNYDNTWKGEGLTNGIYFYHLHHVEDKKIFKGWVEVIN